MVAGGRTLGSEAAVKGVVEFGSMAVEDEEESSEEDENYDDDFDDDDEEQEEGGEQAREQAGESEARGAVAAATAAKGRRPQLAYDSDDGAVETSFAD